MLKRIVFSSLFAFFVVSLLLYVSGVRAPVHLSGNVIAFLRTVVYDFDSWKFELPLAPEFVSDIGEGFDAFINFFGDLWNGLVTVINSIIAVIQFIVTLIWDVAHFIGDVVKQNVPVIPVV